MALWSSRKRSRERAAAEAEQRQQVEREAARQRILDEAERQRQARELNRPALIDATVPLAVAQRSGHRPRLVSAARQPTNRGRW